MTFVHRTSGAPRSLAIFGGAFNPPTTAHIALACAALSVVEEVLFVIPRTLPHKQYHGATLDQRLDMLQRIARQEMRFSAAAADGGLFVDLAREARPHYPDAKIWLLCGRDTAERILTWDYGDPEFTGQMLKEFGLLVAPRSGAYEPETRFQEQIRTLEIEGNFDECSSTRLREARRSGEDWRSLAPTVIADLIEELYL